MAHPVRPESYQEISNFYTSAVYEKGAGVVRMLQTLVGVDGFRRGMDLYFKRHDGEAVTCDDFVAAIGDANARDLNQFRRWFAQEGTPPSSRTCHARVRIDTGDAAVCLHQRAGTAGALAAARLFGTGDRRLPLHGPRTRVSVVARH